MKKIFFLIAIYNIHLQPINAAMIISDENVDHSIILDDTTSFVVPYDLNVKLTKDTQGIIISEKKPLLSQNPFETHNMTDGNNNAYHLVITPNEFAFELPDNVQIINNHNTLIILPENKIIIKKEKNPKKRKNCPTQDNKNRKKTKTEQNNQQTHNYIDIKPYPDFINNNTIDNDLNIKFFHLHHLHQISADAAERHQTEALLAEMYHYSQGPANHDPNKLMHALIFSFIASHKTYDKNAQKLAEKIYKEIINKKY